MIGQVAPYFASIAPQFVLSGQIRDIVLTPIEGQYVLLPLLDALWEALRRIADVPSESAALLERAVLAGLEAGCAAPVAVSATVAGDRVAIVADVYAPDGQRALRAGTTTSLERLADDEGRRAVAAGVVAELLDGGAAELAGLPERRS